MELDEIKQVSKELEDILEGFPDVPKGPVLQETKKTNLDKLQGAEDVETPCEDEATATLDSEIEDQELEAEDREFGPEDQDFEPEDQNLEPESDWDQPESRSQEAVLLRREDERRETRKQKRENFANGILRPGDGYLAAFLVPVVIMVIIFAQRGIFPFGDESFLRTDMYHQYAPFFSEFRHKLADGGSLLYSWNVGMGVNFAALYAYYLASPLNWLIILCPKGYVIEFMTYMIVLKTGLAGLTFAWYLRKHCKTRDFGVAYFAIFYALSGYMAAYSWNIMWLDCILLFPVIMLGLEQLVKEGKGLLYGVSLGVCILSNYYISIMICMFMVIYFFALWILERGRNGREFVVSGLKFAGYSLLAGGLSAAVLLPEIFALQMTASGDVNFPKTVTSYFSIFDMIARHLPIVETEIGLDHWPNLYCGVAVLLFFLLYLGCRQIRVREKAVYCGLLLLFMASFSINVLNFIWHGFHYPNSLPCRQSFIYIFLVLLVSYEAYTHLRETPRSHVAFALGGSIGFVILAEKLVDVDDFQFYTYLVAIAFLALYGGLIYLYKSGKRRTGTVLLAALALVSVEAAVNMTVTSVTTTSRSAYVKDNKEVETLAQSLLPADTFYRIEKVTRKTKNDGAWMNFPSVSLFSSVANADLTAFFKTVGCEGSTNAYSITGSTPLIDSLFSVKYGLYSEPQEGDTNLILIRQEGGTYLYARRDTLPVGFMVPSDIDYSWQRDLGNPVSVQNDLCGIIGVDRVLEQVDVENDGNTARFTPETAGMYYVYIANRKVEQVDMSPTGESERSSKKFKNVNRGYLLELGWCHAGEELVLKGEDESQSLNAEIYHFNYDALHQVYNALNRYPLQVTSWTDDSLSGVVNTDQSGTLFTSIPYDKGWTILVDGVKMESSKVFDTFLCVDLTEGTHTVEFRYEPQGQKIGICISVVCALILGTIAWIDRGNRKKEIRNR